MRLDDFILIRNRDISKECEQLCPFHKAISKTMVNLSNSFLKILSGILKHSSDNIP